MPERLLSAAACAEIAARAAKATAGPWFSELKERGDLWPGPWSAEDTSPLTFGWDGEEGIYGERADFDFIAAAREDIPALLRTVAALRESMGALLKELEPSDFPAYNRAAAVYGETK